MVGSCLDLQRLTVHRAVCVAGMGVTTITAARILKGQLLNQTGEETVMTMDTFPNVGLAKVHTHTSMLNCMIHTHRDTHI